MEKLGLETLFWEYNNSVEIIDFTQLGEVFHSALSEAKNHEFFMQDSDLLEQMLNCYHQVFYPSIVSNITKMCGLFAFGVFIYGMIPDYDDGGEEAPEPTEEDEEETLPIFSNHSLKLTA